jgi:hypothetical protein
MEEMSERSVRFGIVKHISHDHIRSAIHLAKLTLSTEENFKAKPHDGIPYYSHRAYAIGTILLCVAFLESRINELIIGVTLGVYPWKSDAIENTLFESLQATGKLDGVRRLRTLEKYQLILSLLGKKQFDSGTRPYQDIEMLIALRNKLVHFEPDVQWQDDEHKFMKKFKNKKIAANPLTADLYRTEFPDTLLSYSWTKWAIQSSIKFVVEFDTRIGLISTFAEFEN